MPNPNHLPSLSNRIAAFFPWVLALAVVGYIVSRSIVVVPEASVGKRPGANSTQKLTEGWYWQWPLGPEVRVLEVKDVISVAEIDTMFRDLQTVSYRLQWQNEVSQGQEARLANDYPSVDAVVESIIVPLVCEAAEQVTARFTAEEFVANREHLGRAIRERYDQLTMQMAEGGRPPINLGPIVLTEVRFSPELRKLLDERMTTKSSTEALIREAETFGRDPGFWKWRAIQKWDGRLPLFVFGATDLLEEGGAAPWAGGRLEHGGEGGSSNAVE